MIINQYNDTYLPEDSGYHPKNQRAALVSMHIPFDNREFEIVYFDIIPIMTVNLPYLFSHHLVLAYFTDKAVLFSVQLEHSKMLKYLLYILLFFFRTWIFSFIQIFSI